MPCSYFSLIHKQAASAQVDKSKGKMGSVLFFEYLSDLFVPFVWHQKLATWCRRLKVVTGSNVFSIDRCGRFQRLLNKVLRKSVWPNWLTTVKKLDWGARLDERRRLLAQVWAESLPNVWEERTSFQYFRAAQTTTKKGRWPTGWLQRSLDKSGFFFTHADVYYKHTPRPKSTVIDSPPQAGGTDCLTAAGELPSSPTWKNNGRRWLGLTRQSKWPTNQIVRSIQGVLVICVAC